MVDLAALKASCPPARGLSAPGSFGVRVPGSSFLPASPCPPSLTGWFRSEAGADAKRNEKLVPAPEESGSSWGPKTHLQETLKQQCHAALGSIVLSLSDEGRQLAEFLKGRGHVDTAMPSAKDALKQRPPPLHSYHHCPHCTGGGTEAHGHHTRRRQARDLGSLIHMDSRAGNIYGAPAVCRRRAVSSHTKCP